MIRTFSAILAAVILTLLSHASAYAAEGSITIPDASKKLRALTVTTSEGTVYEQAIVVCDPTGTTCTNVMTSSPAGTEGGVVTRNIPSGTQTISGNVGVSSFGGSAVVTGTGTSGAGIPRVTVSSDSFPTTATTSSVSIRCVNTAGNSFESCGGSGGQSDDSAFTVGSSTTLPVGGTYRSSRDTVDDNDAGTFAMNQRRGLFITPESSASTELYPEPAAAADGVSNPTLTKSGSYLFGFNGSTWDRLRVDTARNLLTLTPDTVGSTTAINALNAAASVAMAGQNGAIFFLASGTLAATLTPEVSFDGGTTWSTAQFVNPTTGVVSLTSVHTNPNSATQLGILIPSGATHVRVRDSSHTSGTANGTVRATSSAITGLYGSDGTNMRAPIVKNSAPSGSEYGLVVWPQGTFGGYNTPDSTAFSRGSTSINPMGCVVETTAGSYTTGASRGIRCNASAEQYVSVPDRGKTMFLIYNASTASVNNSAIRNGASVLAKLICSNTGANGFWAKVYNTNAATVGTTTPVSIVWVPPGGRETEFSVDGGSLDTGLSVATVGGYAHSDTTTVPAASASCTVVYAAAG